MNENQMPILDQDFFDVVSSAIKNCSWKYSDFEKVKKVEGLISALHSALIVEGATVPNLNDTNEVDVVINSEPNGSPAPLQPAQIGQNKAAKILTPEEAKKAPERPMPDDILELVKIGVDIAKNPPPVREVKVEELPSDPDAARAEWNKAF